MPLVQEYINQKYPTKEERRNVTKLNLSREKVISMQETMMMMGSFLPFFDVRENRYLQRHFQGALDCPQQPLEGYLDLRDFVSLRKLNISHNRITGVDISCCSYLSKFACSNNFISNLDLTNNPDLEFVDASKNNIRADLSVFSHLQRLEFLNLEYDLMANLDFLEAKVIKGEIDKKEARKEFFKKREKIEELGFCVSETFFGSLENLANCKNLKYLNINNLDEIREGINFLPASLAKFECRGTKFEEQLKPFDYDFQVWRTVFNHFGEKIENLQKELQQTKDNVTGLESKIEELKNQNLELKEKNSQLEEELQMEREEAEKALEKAKEWRERQLKEITKQKNQEIEKLRAQLEKSQLQTKISRLEEKVTSMEITQTSEINENKLQAKIIYKKPE